MIRQGARAVRALPRCLLRRLSRGLFAGRRRRRHPDHRGAVAGPAAGRRFSPPRRRISDNAVGLKVWSYERPIPLSERVPVLENMGFKVVDERTYQIAPARRPRQVRRLAPRHAARARRRRARSISKSIKQGARGGVPGGDERRRRERRLQRARAGGRADVARRGADPHHFALPAADPRALFAGLHVGDAGQACGHRRRHRAPVPGALRSAPRSTRRTSARHARPRSPRRSKPRCRRSKASTRIASCATSSTRCRRRSAPISIRSTPTGSRSS